MNAVFEFMTEALARRQAGLPKHIETVLEACTLVPRDNGDGDVRIAVLARGGRSFYLDQAEKRIRHLWPELSPKQVMRACEYLQARAKLLRCGQCKPRKKNWALDY